MGCLSADWAGILILSNSFVHCFVLCVWVRVSRPCMLLLAVDVLVPVGSASALLGWSFFLGTAGFFSLVAVVLCFWFWLPSRFLPWWLGCWRFGPLSPGFPLPSAPPWLSSGFFCPVSVLLVPPSGYMIVFATVRLSYLWHGVSWLIGSCLHSASWQQSLRPCVGLCPLYHGVGVVHVPLAPALRYSPSSGPESP